MSYTIMYGRQFIKTTRGIIPLALFGDNNVTERVHGREVRARQWGVYANNGVEFTPTQYMKMIRGWCGGKYQEHFVKNGKWVDDKGLISWAMGGIKNALPIEDILFYARSASLEGYIYVGSKTEFRNKFENYQFFHTTLELEAWLDKAYVRLEELKKDTSKFAFIVLGFHGREPLGVAVRNIHSGPVLACVKRGSYITRITENSYSLSEDVSEAFVFSSAQEAYSKMQEAGFRSTKLQFVKAQNKYQLRDYVILAKTIRYPNGLYLGKLTSRRMCVSRTISGAKKFVSAREAERYIEKLGNKFQGITEYAVVRV